MENIDIALKRNITQNFDTMITSSKWLNNDYVKTALYLIVAAYSLQVAPKLPNFILDLFNYTVFRVLMMFLILVVASKNAFLSLAVAIGFWISVYYAQKIVDEEEMKKDKVENFLDSVFAM